MPARFASLAIIVAGLSEASMALFVAGTIIGGSLSELSSSAACQRPTGSPRQKPVDR